MSSVAQRRKYHLTTFGCQMNQHDSERMEGMLQSLGWDSAADQSSADLILFNTCSIREKADERFIQYLYEARMVKRAKPETVIGVGGCWAQSLKEEVFRKFPFVDVAFGPGQVGKLAEFLNSDSLSAQGYFEFETFTGHLPKRSEKSHSAWVQISVGCNCNCSYCIVPTTRGREASRPQKELVAEVRELVANGVKEVTLLGQNVNSYGRDLQDGGRTTFSGLLTELDGVSGLHRLRYTSPHPKDMKEDVVTAHSELKSLCEHIHLPLQAGSSSVLKMMRRTYSRERYLERVEMIRSIVPDISITTDIIVGFPGETEEDFQQTIDMVEEVGFDGAFTFIFSARRGTAAAELPDSTSHEEKVERMERLLPVVQRRARERGERFIGREMDILVEGSSRTDSSRLRGRTSGSKAVNFDGVAEPGQIVPVLIESASSLTLGGTQVLAGLPA